MTKYFYKLVIAYNGHNYHGWQIQKETDLTIQGQLEIAFRGSTGINAFKTIGSGRTDAGVHALAQVVLLEVEKKLPDSVFIKGVNERLPEDIQIISVAHADDTFHPIFSARSKTYKYVITTDKLPPFLSSCFLYMPRTLDVDVLARGTNYFQGKHDFCNYFCVGTSISSTVREIYKSCVSVTDSFSFGEFKVSGRFIIIEFTGSGFLKQQVRLMVGALLALNEKRVSFKDIEDSLTCRNNKHLGAVAPARGLYLDSVVY
jgi:tRNA pseudouridine38-40 synthase